MFSYFKIFCPSLLCNKYIFFYWLYTHTQLKSLQGSLKFSKKHYKVCISFMLYQQILSRATPKCGEQLKCGEQKYVEDIILVRWQHHFWRQVNVSIADDNFWSSVWILTNDMLIWGSFLRPIQLWGQNWSIFYISRIQNFTFI